MGRGGYNGGSPAVNTPKENSVYIFPLYEGHFEIPKDFQILKAGEGLQNEQGGIQAEFGYIITKAENVELKADSKLKPQSFPLRKLRGKKGRKNKEKLVYHWIAASSLLEQVPELVRDYHLEHPTAPKPHGFDVKS